YGAPHNAEGTASRTPTAMTYDPKKHHRRSIRLRGHNYSDGGAYFITICVQDKQCMLGRVVDSRMTLSECGEVVHHVWETLPQRFPTLVLDAFQLMPNHLHAILVIPGTGLEPSLALAAGAAVIQPGPQEVARESPTRTPSMAEVVGAFKS